MNASPHFFTATYNADCEDPYPSLSDFHDYEPNLEFDDSDLLQQKHPENDDGEYSTVTQSEVTFLPPEGKPRLACVSRFLTNFFFIDYDLPEVDRRVAGTPNEFIESPMSDGTIEEDFEKALAKEVGTADRRPSETSGNLTLEGNLEDEDFSDIARYGFVEVVGDDVKGCKIIVFSACRLPPNKNFDYARY